MKLPVPIHWLTKSEFYAIYPNPMEPEMNVTDTQIDFLTQLNDVSDGRLYGFQIAQRMKHKFSPMTVNKLLEMELVKQGNFNKWDDKDDTWSGVGTPFHITAKGCTVLKYRNLK